MNVTSDVPIPPVKASLINNGIDVVIDYKTWVPKSKPGKKVVNPIYEASRPSKKIAFRIIGKGISSFGTSKLEIIAEIAETNKHVATVLRAAENGRSGLSNLTWYAYISKSQTYPKTGDRVAAINTDSEWLKWLETCDVSREKVCGLDLVMENPATADKKRRQEEAIIVQATKINRRQSRKKKRKLPKKTNGDGDRGLTAEERALDDDEEVTNDSYESASESGESTGGDTDSDAVKIVADAIFKRHPIKPDYSTSVPVFVDPKNTERFFYITTDMARVWARAKIECDANESKVVTLYIPPTSSDIKWVTRSAEKIKRNKGSRDSTNQDFGTILTQLVASMGHPPTGAAEVVNGAALKAPLSSYLDFCGIVDLDRSIEGRLTRAGFDQYDLFDQNYLPREDLVKLDLRPGDIARLFKNVNGFAKKLIEEQV